MTSNNSDKFKIDRDKLLLVEGNDDKFFMLSLFQKLLIDNIQIISYDGKDNLQVFIKALKTLPNFDKIQSIGFTRDADENDPGKVFYSIKSALIANNFAAPEKIASFAAKKDFEVRTGIYIFPDCVKKGELEDLCLQAILDNPEIPCIEQFTQCIAQLKALKKLSKTKLYAWLATQDSPSLRIGEAAKKSLIDFEHPAFTTLKRFLLDLSSP